MGFTLNPRLRWTFLINMRAMPLAIARGYHLHSQSKAARKQ